MTYDPIDTSASDDTADSSATIDEIDATVLQGLNLDEAPAGLPVSIGEENGDTVFTAAPDLPQNGLIHEYTVSETSGSTVADSQGTNDWSLTGPTLNSDSTYFDGAFADFDGTDDFASLSQISFIDVDSAFSIVFGTQIRDASVRTVLFNKRSPTTRIGIGTGNGAPGFLQTAIFDGSSFLFDDFYDLSGLGRVGDRILVTLTWDGASSGAFYLDDAEFASSGSNAVTPLNSGIEIGRRIGTNQFNFDGNVDLCLIYNRQLTASEVGDIYTAWD
jgi:hypothetical protein